MKIILLSSIFMFLTSVVMLEVTEYAYDPDHRSMSREWSCIGKWVREGMDIKQAEKKCLKKIGRSK